jgi:hypothetical protein
VKKWLESVRTADWNKMISDALAPIITAPKDFFVKMGRNRQAAGRDLGCDQGQF